MSDLEELEHLMGGLSVVFKKAEDIGQKDRAIVTETKARAVFQEKGNAQ